MKNATEIMAQFEATLSTQRDEHQADMRALCLELAGDHFEVGTKEYAEEALSFLRHLIRNRFDYGFFPGQKRNFADVLASIRAFQNGEGFYTNDLY